MCGLFGFSDYKGNQSTKFLNVLCNSLARESEIRGSHATGIAYIAKGVININKHPKPASKINFKIPNRTVAVMGHTRHTIQGSENKNYNRVEDALTSEEALEESGLNWTVAQKPVYTSGGILIPNYKANIRSSDNQVLGVVTDRYRIVQNQDAFAFTNSLIGEGVKYETAGSLQSGRKVWLLVKLPDKYIVNGDQIEPYIVFSNSHDGSSAIRVVRVVCQNTLNLALSSTKRSWSAKHTQAIYKIKCTKQGKR